MSTKVRYSNRLTACTASRSQCGAIMVETSMSLVLFLPVLFMFMTLAVTMYRSVSLQYLANQGIRVATIGDVSMTGSHLSTQIYTVAALKTQIKAVGRRFGLTLNDNQIHICRSAIPNCISESTGNPGDLISIDITDEYRLFNLTTLSLHAQAVGLNENQK